MRTPIGRFIPLNPRDGEELALPIPDTEGGRSGRLGFGDAEVADGPAVPGWVGGDSVGRVGEVEVDGDGFRAGGFGCDFFEESVVLVASNDEAVGVQCAGDLVLKANIDKIRLHPH